MKNKGITLIALVITIVIILILAVITLNSILGENGLINRTERVSEEQQKQTATEFLKLKIAECQIESIADKGQYPTLAYLAAYLQNEKNKNGEIEYVESASRVTASLDETPYISWEKIYTKLSKYSFEFEIDSNFKISVNGNEVAIPSGYMKIPTETLEITENGEYDVINKATVNVNVASQSLESDVINNFEIEVLNKNATTIEIGLKNTITTTDESEVKGYIIYLGNKVITAVQNLPYAIADLTRSTTYSGIYVEAIDQNGKIKKSNVINNEETLAATTIRLTPIQVLASSDYSDSNYNHTKAFDGNESTYWHQSTSRVGNKEWCGAQFSSTVHIDYFTATSHKTYSMTLQGSNDGVNWTEIQTFDYNSEQRYEVTASNSVSYSYYSLKSTNAYIDDFVLREINFYGYESD